MPLLLVLILACACIAQEPPYDYLFFDNSLMPGGYFYSSVSAQGDSWVGNLGGKLPVTSDKSALVLRFVNGSNGSWTATVQHRPVRGRDDWDNGVNVNSQEAPFAASTGFQLKVYSFDDLAADQAPVLVLDGQPLELPSLKAGRWTPVTFFVRPGFPKTVEIRQKGHDGKEHRLLLDEIGFVLREREVVPVGLEVRAGERHVDLMWPAGSQGNVRIERSEDGVRFETVAIRPMESGRYTDWVERPGRHLWYRAGRNEVEVSTRELSDEELLTMVQEACFRYYWDGAEPNSGMALENRPGNPHMVATGASGFGIMALVVGSSRGFVTRAQAVERIARIVGFLEKADQFHGAFAHYMDGRTGKVVTFFGPKDNGGDLVETSFLMQGLLTARAYFDRPEEAGLRQRITALWEGVEWDWYRKGDFLVWHWSPDQGFVINHPLIGWNETMITYLLAIASPTHGVPESLYSTGWASQSKEAQEYRGWAQSPAGLLYGNGHTFYGLKLEAGLSNGGPLFFVHYSFLGMDPRGLADRYCSDYFENNRKIALINQRYCMANPLKKVGYGADCWGLTASDGPWSYSADEPVERMDLGKITPTGAIASMPYTPEESLAALKHDYRDYGSFLWGEYGFRDSFNLTDNWCAELFMGLNQAPMVVMIENHRTGLPWKLFMSNPEIQSMRRRVFR